MRFLTFPLLIIICSCHPQQENSTLLEHAYRDGQLNIIMELHDIQHLSKNIYNGKPDSLIKVVDEIFELRRKAGFKLGSGVYDINYDSLESYLSSASKQEHLFKKDANREDFISLIQETEQLIKLPTTNNNLIKLFLAINSIDRLLLSGVKYSFSDGHELLKFNFHFHESDKPQIDVPFKVFITPQFALPEKWNVTIDSLKLTRNGESIPESYSFELIGSVAYFEISPTKIGRYELTGTYSAIIEEEFVDERGDFHYTFDLE